MSTHLNTTQKIASALGMGVLLFTSAPIASAEPIAVGCSPIVDENIGFNDREPGWINRYQDTRTACQLQQAAPDVNVGVESPVTYSFDQAAQLQRDVVQDLVDHVQKPGLEYGISYSLSDRSPQQLRTRASHTFPGSELDPVAAQQRISVKDSLEDYLHSVGAEPYEVDTGAATEKILSAKFSPAPGYEVIINFIYETDADSEPQGNDAQRTVGLFVWSDFVGDPSVDRPAEVGGSTPEYPQPQIVAR